MTKWEYATIPLIIHATKQILDQWGDDGWELVQVFPGPNGDQPGRLFEEGEAVAMSGTTEARMSAVEERLAGLGLSVPEVAAPVAAYVPAVVAGNYVYTSGQLPFVKGELQAVGKVGDGAGLVSAEEANKLAATAAVDALAAVKSVIGDLDRITRIVKVVGFVASNPPSPASRA